MQTSEEREEEKTQEKYTQFTPPYPNKFLALVLYL